MIDFIKEKNYSSKNMKLNIMKHKLTQGKFRIPKFVCSAHFNDFHDNRLILYFGLNNGNIISLIIYKQKRLYNKCEDFILLKCKEINKHDGAVNALLTLTIQDVPRLISAGIDGTFKLWTGEPELREKDQIHYIDTLYKDQSTIIEIVYCKKRNLIIGVFSDIKIKILQIENSIDNKKNHITKLSLISVIDKFNVKINPNKDKQYLITSLSLKESDICELYVADNKGRVMTYHYVDDNYLKYQSSGKGTNKEDKKFIKNTFNYIEKVNLHKTFGVIKVIHNNYDNVIYTCGYDNHVICYNTKNQQKVFDILSTNTKTHINTMILSHLTKELIIGDDFGNITFIDIFNKSEFKYKPIQGKILSIQQLNIFQGQEHMFFMIEDLASIFRIIRKTKVAITKHHDAEIMKIFVTEPVQYEGSIIEDSKVISIGFDNKIKIWDFLTMECINQINGPEIPKISVVISSVCYLKDSELIAIGTDSGHIFFYDINNNEYLPITYEEKYRHKGVVTDIISFMKIDKDDIKIESMLSCSDDGIILFWEINKKEIKEIKRKNQFNYDESDEFILKGIKNKNKDIKKTEEDLEKGLKKFLQSTKRRELKIYKCTPSIKKCIIEKALKFNVLAFQYGKNHANVFSGINGKNIYVWDYNREKSLAQIKGNNSLITCMIVEEKKNYLIAGGTDGLIDIWDLSSKPEEREINIKYISTINDPDISKNFIPIINDLIILPRINIMIICNNNKKLYFFDTGRLSLQNTLNPNPEHVSSKSESESNRVDIKVDNTQIIKKDNEINCLSCLESYGKLLCGTKQKMIIEITLNEELAKAGYKEIYDKYPFTKNKINYEEGEIDKFVNNFKIMKFLTQKDELYNK